MKVPVIQTEEDMEIILLKGKVKLGGNYYEEKYSFWARLIPTHIKNGYTSIRKKKVEELNDDEQQLLVDYCIFSKFASLQERIDSGNYTKLEYINYLKMRANYPLEILRNSKLSDDEAQEIYELINKSDILPNIEDKEELTVLERYLKEVLEEKSFKEHIKVLDKKMQYRMREIDVVHSKSYELAKNTRMS